jgi:hypothetical protein
VKTAAAVMTANSLRMKVLLKCGMNPTFEHASSTTRQPE